MCTYSPGPSFFDLDPYKKTYNLQFFLTCCSDDYDPGLSSLDPRKSMIIPKACFI